VLFTVLVIEVKIPTEEDLMQDSDGVAFPSQSASNNSDSKMFSTMTPMIQISSVILIDQIRRQGLALVKVLCMIQHYHLVILVISRTL